MPTIRTTQPIGNSVPGISVTTFASATALPIGLSLDRKTVYGVPNGGVSPGTDFTLYQSTDDGTTWTSVHAFTGEVVTAIRETDDGEALVVTQAGAGTPGYVYKTTGWSTSHTSATWTKVLTSTGGYFQSNWALTPWSFGDDTIAAATSRIGVLAEYGVQTSASGDQTPMARRVYLTQNYGATWNQIFDIYTWTNSGVGEHLHSAVYDARWDRIWLSYGDQAAQNNVDKAPILYSDDRGVTWTAVARTGYWANNAQSNSVQVTAIGLTDTAILFGSDNEPGLLRLARTSYRKMSGLHAAIITAPHNGAVMIAESIWQNRRQPGAPIFMTQLANSSGSFPGIWGSIDNGDTWSHLWTDRANAGNGYISRIVGPTFNGKIIASSGTGTGTITRNLFVGELVQPEANLKVGLGNISGDGTTTVFNFAHGIGITPTRYHAWHEKPAGSYTVSSDATNIIITFAAAPTNGTSIPFQWRAAA